MTQLLTLPLLDRIVKEIHDSLESQLGLMDEINGSESEKASGLARLIAGITIETGPSMFFHEDNLKMLERTVDENISFRTMVDKISGRIAYILGFSGVTVPQFSKVIIDSFIAPEQPLTTTSSGTWPAMFRADEGKFLLARENFWMICLYLATSTHHMATWPALFNVMETPASN